MHLSIGSIVTLRPDFGRGAPREVEVVGFGIEAGQLVIDYRDGDARRWAYGYQIDTPEQRSAA